MVFSFLVNHPEEDFPLPTFPSWGRHVRLHLISAMDPQGSLLVANDFVNSIYRRSGIGVVLQIGKQHYVVKYDGLPYTCSA